MLPYLCHCSLSLLSSLPSTLAPELREMREKADTDKKSEEELAAAMSKVEAEVRARRGLELGRRDCSHSRHARDWMPACLALTPLARSPPLLLTGQEAV